MHSRVWLSIVAAVPLMLAAGCSSTPTSEPSAEATAQPSRASSFSADLAWRHLQELTGIGARPVGSDGNARARRYLQRELEELGLETETWEVAYGKAAPASDESARVAAASDGAAADAPPSGEPVEGAPPGEASSESAPPGDVPAQRSANAIAVTNLTALIPGTQSEDRLLLVAPFDTQAFDDFEFVGANDGASGAAVVLEMARAIAADPFPYATQIVFVDGEAPFLASDTGRRHRAVGRAGLATRIQQLGVSRVRLMVFVNRVGDADLEIARDLMSERVYREEFWKAAAKLERSAAFPDDAQFENAGLDYAPFLMVGFRRFVSIVDTRYGGEQPPGSYAGTAEDTIEHCAPESLEAVGAVVLEGLDAISKRLIKIDRFTGTHGVRAVSASPLEYQREPASTTQLDAPGDVQREEP